jgi:hypothetical protein
MTSVSPFQRSLRSLRLGILLWISCHAALLAQTSVSGTLPVFPKYIVMGVVYAPPGSSSYVSYGNSQLVGSADSIQTTNSSTSISTTTVTKGGFLGLFGGSTQKSTSDGWTTSQQGTSAIQLQSTMGNSIQTMGPISASLGVNHDNDVIYIWLNPVAPLTVQSYNSSTGAFGLNWTGLASNGCDLTDTADGVTAYQTVAGCDPSQYPYPDVIGIPVWCLKNPYSPVQGCAQWLPYTSRSWDLSPWGTDPNTHLSLGPGLTLQDYADILQADPFVALNGATTNVCHPTYGPSLDPNDPETISTPAALTAQQASLWVNPPILPTTCGPVNTQMTRFQPVGEVEYPVPGPNGLPSTYSGSFQYSQTTSLSQVATDSHTTGTSKDTTSTYGTSFGFFGFPIAAFNASFMSGTSNSVTLTHQYSSTLTSGTSSSAAYSITGPQLSDSYTGPATYNVFQDNVYGTFAFYSNLQPKVTLGSICVNSTVSSAGSCGAPGSFSFGSTSGSVMVGSASAGQLVTLTNNSQYPLTMAGPAVTFSDPGFAIVQDGSDSCSNRYLQPQGSCTLNISFSPVFSDAPNTSNGPTTTVYATMIVAGTENASIAIGPVSAPATQNTLVIAEASLTGVAAPNPANEAGATLTPATYTFSPSFGVAQQETFTYKNLNSSSVVFPATADITLGETADFSIASDTCRGLTLTSQAICTFSVVYSPSASSKAFLNGYNATSNFPGCFSLSPFLSPPPCQPAYPLVATSISANATPVIAGGSTVASATASAVGQLSDSALLAQPTVSLGTYTGKPTNNFVFNANPTTFTVTNGTPYTVSNLTFPATNNQWDPITPITCTSSLSLAPGASCTAQVAFVIEYACGNAFQEVQLVEAAGTYANGPNSGLSVPVSAAVATLNLPASTCPPAGQVKVGTAAGPQSITAGGSLTIPFTVAPTGSTYPGIVTFSISGLPVGATAAFSPASLAATAGAQNVSLSIQTVGGSAKAEKLEIGGRPFPVWLAFLLMPLAAGWRLRRGKRSLPAMLAALTLVACSLVATSALVACGGSNTTSTAGVQASPQTYNVSITATTGGSSQSITVPLTVN